MINKKAINLKNNNNNFVNFIGAKSLLYHVTNELLKHNPNPATELKYTNHFTLLIAVMLSAQATDKSVNKATEGLFKIIKTPSDILSMKHEDLESHFKTINYYKTKTKNIIQTSKILVERFNSAVPSDIKLLTSLPGVGVKTANVIMLEAFNKNAIAVDTHVFRLSHRLGICSLKTPNDVSAELIKLADKKQIKYIHHLFVLHGRYVCKKIKPLCGQCVVSNFCKTFKNVNC